MDFYEISPPHYHHTYRYHRNIGEQQQQVQAQRHNIVVPSPPLSNVQAPPPNLGSVVKWTRKTI